MHVRALGRSIIILNDAQYAIDMLEKKSLLYSDRPSLVVGVQLVGWDEGLALMQFSELWSEHRRLLGQFMGTKVKVEAFDFVVQAQTNVFLKSLLAEPREWVEHARWYIIPLSSMAT